jgi:hypothetical protein
MNNSSPIPPHLQAPLPPNSQWTFDLIERKSWASLWIFVNNITGDIYFLVLVEKTPASLQLFGPRLIWAFNNRLDALRHFALCCGKYI